MNTTHPSVYYLSYLWLILVSLVFGVVAVMATGLWMLILTPASLWLPVLIVFFAVASGRLTYYTCIMLHYRSIDKEKEEV